MQDLKFFKKLLQLAGREKIVPADAGGVRKFQLIDGLAFENNYAAPLQSAFNLGNERPLKVLNIQNDFVGLRLDLVSIQVRIRRRYFNMTLFREALRFTDRDFRKINAIHDEAFFREKNGISAFAHRDVERATEGKDIDMIEKNLGRFLPINVSVSRLVDLIPLGAIAFDVVARHLLKGVRPLRKGVRLGGCALTAAEAEREGEDRAPKESPLPEDSPLVDRRDVWTFRRTRRHHGYYFADLRSPQAS